MSIPFPVLSRTQSGSHRGSGTMTSIDSVSGAVGQSSRKAIPRSLSNVTSLQSHDSVESSTTSNQNIISLSTQVLKLSGKSYVNRQFTLDDHFITIGKHKFHYLSLLLLYSPDPDTLYIYPEKLSNQKLNFITLKFERKKSATSSTAVPRGARLVDEILSHIKHIIEADFPQTEIIKVLQNDQQVQTLQVNLKKDLYPPKHSSKAITISGLSRQITMCLLPLTRLDVFEFLYPSPSKDSLSTKRHLLGPCASFSKSFRSLCALYQFRTPIDDIVWDIDHIIAKQDKVFNFNEWPELEGSKLMLPMMEALTYSNWFESVIAKDLTISPICLSAWTALATKKSLKRLTLSNVSMTSTKEFLSTIINSMDVHKSSIQYLELSSMNALDDNVMKSLCSWIQHNQLGLISLRLNNCHITHKSIVCLAESLTFNPHHNTTLKHLELSKQFKLTLKMLFPLSSFLNNTNVLETLDLSDWAASSKSSEPGMELVLNNINGCVHNLKRLRLSGCQLKNQDLTHFRTFLQLSESLTELDLSNTKLHINHLMCIFEALELRHPYNNLNLALQLSHTHLGMKEIQLISQHLVKCNSICKFDSSHNDLGGDEGLAVIFNAIRQAPHVKHLTLDSVGTYSKGYRQAPKYLKSMLLSSSCQLKTLSFAQNNWKADTIDICDCLSINKSLESLNISGNNMLDRGAHCLAKSIQVNQSLKELSIDDNGIGHHGFQMLSLALERNKTICRFPMPLNDSMLYLKTTPKLAKTVLSAIDQAISRNKGLETSKSCDITELLDSVSSYQDTEMFVSATLQLQRATNSLNDLIQSNPTNASESTSLLKDIKALLNDIAKTETAFDNLKDLAQSLWQSEKARVTEHILSINANMYENTMKILNAFQTKVGEELGGLSTQYDCTNYQRAHSNQNTIPRMSRVLWENLYENSHEMIKKDLQRFNNMRVELVHLLMDQCEDLLERCQKHLDHPSEQHMKDYKTVDAPKFSKRDQALSPKRLDSKPVISDLQKPTTPSIIDNHSQADDRDSIDEPHVQHDVALRLSPTMKQTFVAHRAKVHKARMTIRRTKKTNMDDKNYNSDVIKAMSSEPFSSSRLIFPNVAPPPALAQNGPMLDRDIYLPTPEPTEEGELHTTQSKGDTLICVTKDRSSGAAGRRLPTKKGRSLSTGMEVESDWQT